MHLSLLLTSLAFSRSYAAADPMTVKNPLLMLTEENADALSHSASMDGYTAVYSPMFQLRHCCVFFHKCLAGLGTLPAKCVTGYCETTGPLSHFLFCFVLLGTLPGNRVPK